MLGPSGQKQRLRGSFAGQLTETGLRVVDVTNPNSPQVISTVFYPNAAYAHQVWLSEDRRFLYLNDELDEPNGLNATTTTRTHHGDRDRGG